MTLQIIEWEKYYCCRMAFSCYFISNKDQVHPCVFVVKINCIFTNNIFLSHQNKKRSIFYKIIPSHYTFNIMMCTWENRRWYFVSIFVFEYLHACIKYLSFNCPPPVTYFTKREKCRRKNREGKCHWLKWIMLLIY